MKRLLIIAMLPLTMASCVDEVLSEETVQDCNQKTVYSTLVADTTMDVSYEDAVLIAKSMVNDAESRSNVNSAWDVKTITDNDGPIMYVVNYPNNGGFVVISAKRSYYPILAQSETGYLDIEERGVSQWLEEQKRIIANSEYIDSEYKTSIASLWMKYNTDKAMDLSSRANDDRFYEKPQVFFDSLKRWTLDESVEVYFYDDYILTPEYQNLSEQQKHEITVAIHCLGNSNYGTIESATLVLRREYSDIRSNILLKTKWNIHDGFEKYLKYPNVLSSEAVAIGQIAKHYKTPERYSWDKMDDIIANDYSARLLCDIQNTMSRDTVSNIGKILNAFSFLGIRSNSKEHNLGRVLSSIYGGRPVLVNAAYGSNNTFYNYSWVYDGYIYGNAYVEIRVMTLEYRPTTYRDPDYMLEAYKINNIQATLPMQLHVNWGAGGYNDGYYTDTNITYTRNNVKYVVGNKNRTNIFTEPY